MCQGLQNQQPFNLQVIDDSRGVYHLRDPKVTVRRAAIGTLVLDIDGARRQPRVRRLE